MDSNKFDSITRSLAVGTSRRSVLKGLLGIGGAAGIGGALLDDSADAARRPAPTPKPVTCPGRQTWNGSACVCPNGSNKCGPECCNTGESVCCDNACCFGVCTGEEQCCGEPNVYCSDTGACLPAGSCCDAGDCAPREGACVMACVAGQCQPVDCPGGQICCQGECVSAESHEACPADPGGCCVRGEELCCGSGGCCPGNQCNEIVGVCCDPGQLTCGTGENACCDAGSSCCGNTRTCCPSGQCTTSGECCSGDNIACAGQCCPEERCTAGVGCCAEGFLACSGGICCSAAVYQCSTTGPGCECLPGTLPCGALPGGCCPIGQCNPESYVCCEPGTHPCVTGCCDDDACEGVVCGQACQHCEDGRCVNDVNYTPCSLGYCLSGFCRDCVSNSNPDSLFSCSLDVECCSGCCLDAALAANACQTQFEGNQELLAACNEYLAPFLGGDVCVQNPLPIPGTEAAVELPCNDVS